MTPIERVREALEDIVHAAFEHGNKCLSGKTLDPDGELLGAAKEALHELEGKVLVPVEPTVAMGLAWNKAAMDCASYFSTAYYKAMIKPYIKDE